jgi:hypothetical protein
MSNPPVRTSAPLRWLSLLVVVAAIVVRFWPHGASAPRAVPPDHFATPAPVAQAPAPGSHAFGEAVGFRSRERLAEHFQKHGREFGAATPGGYLHLAQALRDRPPGGDVLEQVREDGVVTRFDRGTGAFIAFGADGVIRTFFRPNDGERYFERQAGRPHDTP